MAAKIKALNLGKRGNNWTIQALFTDNGVNDVVLIGSGDYDDSASLTMDEFRKLITLGSEYLHLLDTGFWGDK